MKRLLSLVVFAATLFYIAWPAYSGYAIKQALDASDAAGLSERVDFPAVRNSMRPAITTKVEETLDATAAKAGPSAAKIYAALKTKFMPKIVEAALDRAITPEALIRINAERGTIKQILDRMVAEQVTKTGGPGLGNAGLGGSGGLAGQAAPEGAAAQPKFDAGKVLGGWFGGKETGESAKLPAPSAAKAPPMTWRNVKGYGLDGLTGVYVRLAKDPISSAADVTARMSFVDGGWILTGLEPRL